MELYVSRLFDQPAPVFRPQRQHLFDETLAHERVAVLAYLGLHEEFVQVFQPDAALVQKVLVVAATIGAAGDDDFVEIDGQPAIAVVQRDAHLRHAHGGTLLAAGEDDVLCLAGADDAAGLFAQHPADRLRYVRLAGAVRPGDTGDAGTELQRSGRGEALKAVDVEPL